MLYLNLDISSILHGVPIALFRLGHKPEDGVNALVCATPVVVPMSLLNIVNVIFSLSLVKKISNFEILRSTKVVRMGTLGWLCEALKGKLPNGFNSMYFLWSAKSNSKLHVRY